MEPAVVTDDYLNGRLVEQIDYHDRKAVRSQRAYRKLLVVSVVTTSLTPLLLALEMLYSPPPLNEPGQLIVEVLPVIVATVAAVSTISLSAFKYKESWIEHRSACEALRREQALYQSRVGPYDTAAAPEALLVERAEAIMEGDTSVWRDLFETGRDATAGG
jgi:hypothetical protein